MSRLRKIAKRISFETFRWLDRVGIHVLPKHYYTPVADYAWLVDNQTLWARRTDLTGVDWDLDRQLEWLASTCDPFLEEVSGLHVFDRAVGAACGLGYGPIESQVLHCFIRRFRPRRIIEVGSGVSTYCMAHAIAANGAPTAVWAVEPYPRPMLERVPGVVVEKKFAQQVDLTFFDKLEAGDLLFIDSSHAVKTGSDVLYLHLEVIPRLKPGVFIHVHDIFLPYTYSRDTLHHYLGWQETALLLALLKSNVHLRVECALAALHYDRREALCRLLPDYRPQADAGAGLAGRDAPGHFPSSIWLKTA